jgi:hypothetical protein
MKAPKHMYLKASRCILNPGDPQTLKTNLDERLHRTVKTPRHRPIGSTNTV